MPTANSVYVLQRIWGNSDHFEITGVAAHSASLIPQLDDLATHYRGEVIYEHWDRHGQLIHVLDDHGRNAATFSLTLHDLLP